MPKRPRKNKRIDAPHVRLYNWLLNSPAYLSLSCPARARARRNQQRLYNGRNNGQIGLSFAGLPSDATLRAERPSAPLPNSRNAASSNL